MSVTLVKRDAELPYLTQRLICHIDCNSLTPAAHRQLFVSNREAARSGALLQMIRNEVINLLKSDDELIRLNDEARNATMRERDEEAILEARKAVAKLLRLQGLDMADMAAASSGADVTTGADRPVRPPRPPRPTPTPIELHEPPTYLRIVWEADTEIPFYAGQRRYIRVETDAQSSYHDATNPHSSRVNFVVSDGEVAFRASTPLQGGRMRALFECLPSAKVGGKGSIRVELSRPGLSMLSDKREFLVVDAPKPKDDKNKRISLPPFDFQPVEYGDEAWEALGWPEDVDAVASSAESDRGVHRLHYSVDFPPFKRKFEALERRSTALAKTFESRYKIWLIVHSLLYEQQQKDRPAEDSDADDERRAETERTERIRVATLSAMIAAREVQMSEASGVGMEIEEV